ncbi:unnamed protein product [Brassica oleracea var. botrytis]
MVCSCFKKIQTQALCAFRFSMVCCISLSKFQILCTCRF